MSPDWSKAVWRKSTTSDTGGCVGVAYVEGFVGVRDTKDKGAGPVLSFTEHEWSCFVSGVERREFHTETLAT